MAYFLLKEMFTSVLKTLVKGLKQ